MRKAFENAHIFSKGAGNCNCPVNIIRVPYKLHDILDGRTRDPAVERVKKECRVYLEEEPKSYRHKLAWAIEYGYQREVRAAIRHYEKRNRGLTTCTKAKK